MASRALTKLSNFLGCSKKRCSLTRKSPSASFTPEWPCRLQLFAQSCKQVRYTLRAGYPHTANLHNLFTQCMLYSRAVCYVPQFACPGNLRVSVRVANLPGRKVRKDLSFDELMLHGRAKRVIQGFPGRGSGTIIPIELLYRMRLVGCHTMQYKERLVAWQFRVV